MRIEELRTRLEELRDAGFIPTLRHGSTGVGYTLEQRLGLGENNLPIPDIGGRVEVKATRRSSSSLISLFTFNRSVWQIPQHRVIKEFGYVDNKGRQALKSTVSTMSPNTQGLILTLTNGPEMSVSVLHESSGQALATWSIYHLVGKFVTKFERLLLVKADARRQSTGPEEFHYVDAELVSDPGPAEFHEALRRGTALIDIRMHLNERGGVRNRGTALRIRERDLPSLFSKRLQLI